MIITHLRNGVRIHSRVEIYANPTRPTIEMTIVRGEYSFEPTLQLDYEQAKDLIETLEALVSRIDEHAANQPVNALHSRADFLLDGANSAVRFTSEPLDYNGIQPAAVVLSEEFVDLEEVPTNEK